ncbi:hypothetical protein IJ818_06030 [bacterium]|nr:hypothetical protein [bacterium]
MNSENLIIEQYNIYSQHKEKFVDRSFMTNKFYNVLVIVLFVLVFLMKDFVICKIFSAGAIFSIIGILTSILWWLNIDAYNFLIKIKISKAIEEIEKQLPVQPYTLEFTAIKSSKRKKQRFYFADIQKVFAIISLLLFISLMFATSIPVFM